MFTMTTFTDFGIPSRPREFPTLQAAIDASRGAKELGCPWFHVRNQLGRIVHEGYTS